MPVVFLIIILYLFFPFFAIAQEIPTFSLNDNSVQLVQCLGGSCNGFSPSPQSSNTQIQATKRFDNPTGLSTFADFLCTLTVFLRDNIIPPIAVLMTLVAGFLYVTGGSSPEKISLANKALFFTALGLVVFILAPVLVVFIYDLLGATPASGSFVSCVAGDSSGANIITDVLLNIINWFAWVFAVMAVFMGLYSAFLFLTSFANPERAKIAFKTFIFTVVGVVLALFAFSIIYITKYIIS